MAWGSIRPSRKQPRTGKNVPDQTRAVPAALSVIIPTYNRERLLDRTLRALAHQRYPLGDFEVIVADDGSRDRTPEVVSSYRDQLRIREYQQEDLGHRAAAVRNGGARLASAPVLAFLDAGVLPGPDWVREHVAAHQDPNRSGQVVLGYTYGYSVVTQCPQLLECSEDSRPEEIVERLRDLESFQDMRWTDYASVNDDLNRLDLPWVFLWSMNVSFPAADFWAVGGFDEDFQGWGVEDIELGYRLHHAGIGTAVSRAGWAVEAPHERSEGNRLDLLRNCLRFVGKHPHPQPELYWAVSDRGYQVPMEEEWGYVCDARDQVRTRDVRAEIEAATADLVSDALTGGNPPRVAIIGCGGVLPASLRSSALRLVLCDFDEDLLGRISPAGEAAGATIVASCGLRTPLPDQSVDRVVLTSRLAGLWPRWGEHLLREAARIGRDLRGPFLGPSPSDRDPVRATRDPDRNRGAASTQWVS
jgi:glycosyltransferase involved in cell wall biosynthesis